ncbi:MAG TPA: hypothetical protein VMV16_04195 [Solirubrobacteraceae bacterium]|nr:hypothetical protein [Solirubrobacteraceae bacterium]
MRVTATHTGLQRRGSGHLVAVPIAQRRAGPSVAPYWSPVVIRPAVAADADVLRRLAALDSARPLVGGALLAERQGSVVSAVSLSDGRAIADPFVATADTVALLRVRAAQLQCVGDRPAA